MVSREHRQQTSIVLGYDVPGYETSSSVMNQFAGKTRGSSNNNNVALDNVNKHSHVQFGESGTKRAFTTSSRQLDPTGEMHKFVTRPSAEAKDALTRTSAGFGSTVAPYVSSTQLATQWSKDAMIETIALRNEIRQRTGPRPTRGISYDDDVEYVSESQSAFENKLNGSFKPSIMAASVKNDLRATHFALGYEKLEYKTSSHTDRLSPEEFARYATKAPPLHDLRKSTVDIT